LVTLCCEHGETEAETNNPNDGEVLVYACAYHESREHCGCAERLFARLGAHLCSGSIPLARQWR
jgi:hypothetical protein